MTEINLAKAMMENMYVSLAKLELSLITKENVNDLELVKSTLNVNDAQLDEITDTLINNMIGGLHDLVEEIFRRLKSSINNLKLSVVKCIDGIVEQFDVLNTDLQTYRKSMVMNADFYM